MIRGRPKPKIVNKSSTDWKTYRVTEICHADVLYVVLCDGKPFNLRWQSRLTNDRPKYKRVTFYQLGQARLLAKKLNEKFENSSFTVHEMAIGPVVVEETA